MAIVVPYKDRKGEKGKITLNQSPDFDAANFRTFAAAKSYAGFTSYTTLTSTDFEVPIVASTAALMENDKDSKLVLGFEGADGFFKVEIPCPKINVEGGFCIRWGENRAFVPPSKIAGEVGDDGNAIATQVAGFLGQGAGDVRFSYGRLVKRA